MRTLSGWKGLIPVVVLVIAAACSSSPKATGQASTTPSPTPGGPVGISLNQWSVTPTVPTIFAGKVSFTVKNEGTIVHEFVVLRTDTQAEAFKIGSFEGEAGRINEDTSGTNVGETGDMKAGTTKALTIDLSPGHYAFVCNLPGHYGSGMHTDFTVT
jgi:uncharacterized cupredoxin-like copper-binding protein